MAQIKKLQSGGSAKSNKIIYKDVEFSPEEINSMLDVGGAWGNKNLTNYNIHEYNEAKI